MTRARRFHIWSNSGGFPQNQLDAARVAEYLVAQGYVHTSDPGNADVIIVNGCAYRSSKEEQSIAAADP